MIGVAFSLGFTLGPLLGAYLAKRPKEVEEFYQGPALLALAFSIADLFFIFVMLPETLQKENEVSMSFFCGVMKSPSKKKMFWYCMVSVGEYRAWEESCYSS